MPYLKKNPNTLQYLKCWYCRYVVNNGWEREREEPLYSDAFDGESTIYILAMIEEELLLEDELLFGMRILSREKLGFLPGERACASDVNFTIHSDISHELSGFVTGDTGATLREKKLGLSMMYAKAYEVCASNSFFAFINADAERYWKALIGSEWITERLSSVPIEYRPGTYFSGLRLAKPGTGE